MPDAPDLMSRLQALSSPTPDAPTPAPYESPDEAEFHGEHGGSLLNRLSALHTASGGDIRDREHGQQVYQAEQNRLSDETTQRNWTAAEQQRQANAPLLTRLTENFLNPVVEGGTNLVAKLANELPGQTLDQSQMANVYRGLHTINAPSGDPNSALNQGAQLAGTLANYAVNPELGVAASYGNRIPEVNQAQAEGRITEGQANAYQLGSTALDELMGRAAIGGRVSNFVTKALAPEAGLAARMGLGAAVHSGEAGLFQAGQNAVANVTGFDPHRPLEQGVGFASALGGAGGALTGLHTPETEVPSTAKEQWKSDQQASLRDRLNDVHNYSTQQQQTQQDEAQQRQWAARRPVPPTPETAANQAAAQTAHAARTEPYNLGATDREQVQGFQDRMAAQQAEAAPDTAGDIWTSPPPKAGPELAEAQAAEGQRKALVEAHEKEVAAAQAHFGPEAGLPPPVLPDNPAMVPGGEAYDPNVEQRMNAVDRRVKQQEISPEQERRQQEIDRRTADLKANASFQTPEEAGAGPLLPHRLAGEQAVREEYGEPTKQETPTEPAKPNLLQRLATEEHGGEASEYYTRPVVDAAEEVKRAWSSVSDILRRLDRSENSGGFTDSEKAKSEERNITAAIADGKIAGKRVEAQLAPALPHIPKFADDVETALTWADNVESHGTVPGAATPADATLGLLGQKPGGPVQQALTALRSIKQANADMAKDVGLTLDQANAAQGIALSRQYKPGPDYEGEDPRLSRGTVLGDTGTLISPTYEKFSDSYRAATRKGLVPEDPDPLTMQIRAQYEMQRILSLMKQLRSSEKIGSLAWSPNSEPVPEGSAKIEDRIARGSRREAVDKDGNVKYVPPGEDAPAGYKFNGETAGGYYHAQEDVAAKWNSAVKQPLGGEIGELGGKLAKFTTGLRYALNIAHAATAPVQNAFMAMGEVLKKIPGAGRLLGDNTVSFSSLIKDMNIYGPRTNAILRELKNPGSESPEVQDIARSHQRSGADIKTKSVLDPDVFAKAKEALANKNLPMAVLHLANGLNKMIGKFTFDSVLNRTAAIKGRQLVESQRARGIGEEAGAADLRSQTKVLTDALGRHLNTPLFKNSMADALGTAIMPAFKYRIGLLKNVVRAMGNNEHAKTLMAGTVVGTALASAATQMALTLIHTGKIVPPNQMQDYWNPRTGLKDAAGHEERLAFGPGSFMARILGLGGANKAIDEVKGMAPLVTHAYETAVNKDYAGNQVRPTEGSGVGNFARGVGHTLSGALPISVSAQASNPNEEEPGVGKRILKGMGMSFSHPVTSTAEQILYQSLPDSSGRNLEQQAKHDKELRWQGQIKAGDREGAWKEMAADPSVSPADRLRITKQANAATGVAGMVLHPGIGPQTLLKAWQEGSDEDREQMRLNVMHRISNSEPKSRTEHNQWKALREAVGNANQP